MKKQTQESRWLYSHDRGSNCHTRRIDGVMLRRVWSGQTNKDWWIYTVEIGTDTIRLNSNRLEDAMAEVETQWPLSDWWTQFIKRDVDREGYSGKTLARRERRRIAEDDTQ